MASKAEIIEFIKTQFPQAKCTIDDVGTRHATVRHKIGHAELRPGGPVAGPGMLFVADLSTYLTILGEIGIVPLAVTTSLNFNFLRKPAADKDIIGVCKLIKLGRTLAIGEVSIYSEGNPEMVAHAVGTYAIPQT